MSIYLSYNTLLLFRSLHVYISTFVFTRRYCWAIQMHTIFSFFNEYFGLTNPRITMLVYVAHCQTTACVKSECVRLNVVRSTLTHREFCNSKHWTKKKKKQKNIHNFDRKRLEWVQLNEVKFPSIFKQCEICRWIQRIATKVHKSFVYLCFTFFSFKFFCLNETVKCSSISCAM